MAGAEINCRNIAWVLGGFPLAYPQTASLTQAWTRSRHFLRLPKPSPRNWVPPGPRAITCPGNRRCTLWVLPTLPTGAQGLSQSHRSHSSFSQPPQLLVVYLSWTICGPNGMSKRTSVLQGSGPWLPGSMSPAPSWATQVLQGKRERRNHTFHPATDQNPQTLAESLWSPPTQGTTNDCK